MAAHQLFGALSQRVLNPTN